MTTPGRMKPVEWALILSLLALIFMALARPVGAEDDCAEGTWMVQRIGGTLFCVGEGWRRAVVVRPMKPRRNRPARMV